MWFSEVKRCSRDQNHNLFKINPPSFFILLAVLWYVVSKFVCKRLYIQDRRRPHFIEQLIVSTQLDMQRLASRKGNGKKKEKKANWRTVNTALVLCTYLKDILAKQIFYKKKSVS